MNLSCCTWALTGSEEDALTALAAIGFRSIDVQAKTFVSPASRSADQRPWPIGLLPRAVF